MQKKSGHLKRLTGSVGLPCAVLAAAMLVWTTGPTNAETTRSRPTAAIMLSKSPSELKDIEFPVSGWADEFLYVLFEGPAYLDANQPMGVPKPPANESDITRQELLDLMNLSVSGRTSVEKTRLTIENMRGMFPADIFEIYGFLPARDTAPTLWKILDAVDYEARWFAMREKMLHSRARPYALEPKLLTEVDAPPHPSYPSAHATEYAALAEIMSILNPSCEARYRALSTDVARRREIAGVHYASDTDAGINLGQRVARKLYEEGHLKGLIENLEKDVMTGAIPQPTCP